MSTHRIFIIRHGQSATNAGIHDNIPDFSVPLTEIGKKQAFTAGVECSNMCMRNLVFVSPYRRAMETAKSFIEGFESIKRDHSEQCETEHYNACLGPIINPLLREREWRVPDEKKDYFYDVISKLSSEEQFYHESPEVESAVKAADRFENALTAIKLEMKDNVPGWPCNAYVITHSCIFSAWEYMHRASRHNLDNPGDRRYEDFKEFYDHRRLRNCEVCEIFI